MGFFERPEIRKALRDYDFGSIFVAVRATTGLSQMQLGALLDLNQSRVSDVERGLRRLSSVMIAARISRVLGIPARLLGFTSDLPGSLASEEVEWVERRDFLGLTTAAVLGASLRPELERLGHRLPGQFTPVIRKRIGSADIRGVEAITDGFRRSDLAYGAGLCHAAALTELHQICALENADCSSNIRTRMYIATAELATMTAWLAYDSATSVEGHNHARALWIYALRTTYKGKDHPRSTDMSVSILLDMAHQSLHLNHPDDALQLTQLAASTANSRRYPVSTITAGYTSAVMAWCWAALGEAEPTHRALSQSQELYATTDLGNNPPWAWFVNDAEVAAQQGHSLYLLSLTQPRFAQEAVERLSSAVLAHTDDQARSRAVVLPTLAGAAFQTGDLPTALRYGRRAIEAVADVSSQRCYARLRDLGDLARRTSHRSEVVEFRHDIRSVLADLAG
ncbi:helix-turn-helix transcriptional regulator [Nocardia sp. NPDC052001]|uniref:helix-turn-helix domain-containing protein n=1 Tax=Nocardia sp. NPDC052001 TaxID=3154853 RepID=UPI00344921A9